MSTPDATSMRVAVLLMAAFGGAAALTPCPLYVPQTPRVATFAMG